MLLWTYFEGYSQVATKTIKGLLHGGGEPRKVATFNDAKPRLKVVSCSVNEFVVNTNPTWAGRFTLP